MIKTIFVHICSNYLQDVLFNRCIVEYMYSFVKIIKVINNSYLKDQTYFVKHCFSFDTESDSILVLFKEAIRKISLNIS